MNINGNDGPTLIKIFSCEHCKYLGKSILGELGKKQYRCYYNSEQAKSVKDLKLIDGNIDSSKITPEFCPLLLKMNRFEKLKEISGYNDEKKC